MQIRTKRCRQILTHDCAGQSTGFLLPIYNANDPFFATCHQPEQVYLTVVEVGKIKGPHLHMIRKGLFICIKGCVRFVLKVPSVGYHSIESGDGSESVLVEVPSGVALAIQNIGKEDAYILNMPAPAWTPSMNDEHTADFSDFDFTR